MGQSEGSMIHLPAALAGEFPGLSLSMARRLIVQGHVTLNGQVVTDLDVDLDTIPGDPVEFKVARDLTSEALLGVLEANQEVIDERRGEATNPEAQAPLPASVSATREGSQRGRNGV